MVKSLKYKDFTAVQRTVNAVHDDVRDQEGAATVLVAKVRKPPDVPQPHSIAKTRQNKITMCVPLVSFWFIFSLKLKLFR